MIRSRPHFNRDRIEARERLDKVSTAPILLGAPGNKTGPEPHRDKKKRPNQTEAPWHFLYFLPLPQGQGSLRPVFGPLRGRAPSVPST